MTAEVQALIAQAHLNATALERLVGDSERASIDDLLKRLRALQAAYARETESVTQAVLKTEIRRSRPRVA